MDSLEIPSKIDQLLKIEFNNFDVHQRILFDLLISNKKNNELTRVSAKTESFAGDNSN